MTMQHSLLSTYHCERIPVPLPEELAGRLLAVWEDVFQIAFDWVVPVLAGGETAHNADTLYIAFAGDEIASTCRLTHSLGDPRLGAVGEVATVPEHRRQGLANALCAMAAEDFDQAGGEALFLGTSEENAARVYKRLGWERLAAGSAPMVRLAGESPDDFLQRYFPGGASKDTTIRPGAPRDKLPIVPLVLAPHDWIVLDANTGIGSLQHFHQPSCEGLYLRYRALEQRGGRWFAALRKDGAAVGIASMDLQPDGTWRVEAFAHPLHQRDCLQPLFAAAIREARRSGAKAVRALCPEGDGLKDGALRGIGFLPSDETELVCISGQEVRLRRYKMAV